MKAADDIRRELDGGPNLTVLKTRANGKVDEQGKVETTWRDRLAPRSVAALDGKPVRPRKWLVPDWIPEGHLTSVYGRGGGGKTTLALQLGASASVAALWLGMQTKRCRVLGVFCEDDEDELHRRLADAADNLSLPLSDFEGFTYLPRLGLDNLLVERSARGGLVTTALYDDLAEMIRDERVDLGLFDGIADLFGGNVNDPAEATFFLNKMIGLMRPTGGTAVLLGHPNPTVAAAGA
jgi:RecA-family ATPase